VAPKLCLVTGATSGIGKATATRLAREGHSVVIVSRDKGRGEIARSEIASQTKNESVHLVVADLSSLKSIRDLAAELTPKYPSFNILVNNAATFQSRRITTPDGLELMFETNYLGPFLLTRLMIPNLVEGRPSRIINVTAPSTTRPNVDDLQGEKRFSAIGAFGTSKAANLLFTYALARKMEGMGITVNAYHPGIVRTNLNRTAPAPVRFIAGIMSLFVGAPAEVAAEGLVQLATSADFEKMNGSLVHKGHPISAPFADDKELQDRLWSKTCSLVGLPEAV